MRGLLHPGRGELALVDAPSGRTWTHAELHDEALAVAARLRGERSLVVLRAAVTPGTVAGLLGAAAAGHAVALLDDDLRPWALAELLARYGPRFVLHPDGTVHEHDPSAGAPLHDDLALLLATSGTTGSPKLVRLSAAAVEANAAAIAAYLAIGPGERAIASLPFHYAYGLSVLTSHLRAGAAVVLPGAGITEPAFWDVAERHAVTSFAAVPHGYRVLRAAGWERRALPALRTMTQAGGRLDPEVALRLGRTMRERGGRFVVMYGQTEATARMAWLPPEELERRPGSIGVAIPGGRLDVEDGELVFRGPNVMLGYAETRDDLARGDELGGVLRTGDLGHADDDGFHYVTGRRARFAKVLGLRLSLDDVERAAAPRAAAVERDDRAVLVAVEDAPPDEVRARLAERFALPPRCFDVRLVDALPVTSSGKTDYAALRET